MRRYWAPKLSGFAGALLALSIASTALAHGRGDHDHDDDGDGWSAEREELRPLPIPFRIAHARTSDRVVVFMNGGGVRVEPGADDPVRGTSSLAWDAGLGPVSVPAFAGGASRWKSLVECVRTEYAAFNIDITDERPSSGDYIMLVVGGRSDIFGLDRGVAGSATYTGGLLANGIGYAFEKNHGSNERLLCETAAHEIGHSLGLDHEYLCEDLMSYLRGCGEKHFVDEVAECGEFDPRRCHPGDGEQNTWRTLADLLGTKDGVVPPGPRDGHDRGPDRDRDGGDDDDGYARPRGDDGRDDGRGDGDDEDVYGGGYERPRGDDGRGDDGSVRPRGDDGDDDEDVYGGGYVRPRGDDGRGADEPGPADPAVDGDDDDVYGGGYVRPRAGADDSAGPVDPYDRPRGHGDDAAPTCAAGSQYGCEGARDTMRAAHDAGDAADADADDASPARGPRAEAPKSAPSADAPADIVDIARYFWELLGPKA